MRFDLFVFFLRMAIIFFGLYGFWIVCIIFRIIGVNDVRNFLNIVRYRIFEFGCNKIL